MRAKRPSTCFSMRRAVTVVEIVIVMMIMGIMTAVAVPAFFESLLHHRVKSAAHRLKCDLELARSMARLKSAAQTIDFSGMTYTFDGMTHLDDPSAAYRVDLAAAPFGLQRVRADFDGNSTITFDGYGQPSSGGSVVLDLQGHSCTITMEGTTGDVSIQSYHSRRSVPEDSK